MATKTKDPVLVVLQLTGGNDYLNTVIPYTDPNYFDNRPTLHFTEDKVLRIDDEIGLSPYMAPMKALYDRGDVAILHGVGFENSTRSHFRSMDIWHTAEPNVVATEGWLGRVTRELDPDGENPVTTVNFGQGLPRALLADGVSAASVSELSAYGMLTAVEQKDKRSQMLQRFANMYAPAMGTGPVMDYLGQTGLDALKGADMLKVAPKQYASNVEYAGSPIAQKLREVAMVHTADLGSRVFYTEHGGFDTHASQKTTHPVLWTDVNTAVADFWDDLREHDRRRQRDHAHLLRVRTPRTRERHGHRPRRCRGGLRHRPRGQGRNVRGLPGDEGRGPARRRPCPARWTSAAPTRRYSRTGSGWTSPRHRQRPLREAEVHSQLEDRTTPNANHNSRRQDLALQSRARPRDGRA